MSTHVYTHIHTYKKHRSSLHNKSTRSRAVKPLQSLVSAQSNRSTDGVQRTVLRALEQAASSFSSLAEYSGSKKSYMPLRSYPFCGLLLNNDYVVSFLGFTPCSHFKAYRARGLVTPVDLFSKSGC